MVPPPPPASQSQSTSGAFSPTPHTHALQTGGSINHSPHPSQAGPLSAGASSSTNSPTTGSSSLTRIVVAQVFLLLTTLKDDKDRAKWELQAEQLQKVRRRRRRCCHLHHCQLSLRSGMLLAPLRSPQRRASQFLCLSSAFVPSL